MYSGYREPPLAGPLLVGGWVNGLSCFWRDVFGSRLLLPVRSFELSLLQVVLLQPLVSGGGSWRRGPAGDVAQLEMK